jgi:hypothetical protein
MDLRTAIGILANFALVAGLLFYGFRLFAEYHATGKWAKNITSLLAGLGLMTLAVALLITPRNAQIMLLISKTNFHMFFLVASNVLLLAAIAAFGIITYWKPLRLLRQRKIERDLKSELPKIP